MDIYERIELWFQLYGDECKDSEIRDLLNSAMEEMDELDQKISMARSLILDAKHAIKRNDWQYDAMEFLKWTS